MHELFKDIAYLRYWLSVVISFLGDAVTRIVLIFLVARLTESPLLISLVLIAQLLPTGVLSVFIGPLTDHFSKRSLLVGMDVIRAVIVLLMIPALDSVWVLITLILIQGVAKAVFETARIAAIPDLVSRQNIPAAVATFQSTNHVVNLVGPAIGGLMLAVALPHIVLYLDAATFLISGILLGSISTLKGKTTKKEGGERYWGALRSGLRGVWAVPSLRFLSTAIAPVMLVFGLFLTNFNALLLTGFRLPAELFGVAQAIFAVGAVLSALVGPKLVKRFTSQSLTVGSVMLFAFSLILLWPVNALHGQYPLLSIYFWCLATGAGSSLFQVPVANTFLRDLPTNLRGYGVGLMNSVLVSFSVLGLGIGGIAGSTFGVMPSIIFAGAALLLLITATSLFIPGIFIADQMES